MAASYTRHDRDTSRQVHRLFWQSTLKDWPTFVAWLFTRPVGMFFYTILIPFQIAYGLQAIINRNFDDVYHHATIVLLLAIGYCVLWGIGGVAVCRNGRLGSENIQRTVFANYLEKDYDFFANTYLGALSSQAIRLRDAYNEYNTVLMNNLTKQIVVVVSSIAIIGHHSLLLAFVTLAAMAVVLSFTIISGRWRLKYRRLLSEANSETAAAISDALGHGTTVKSFASEAYEKNYLETPLRKQGHTQYWSWMSSIPADLGRMFFAAIAMFLLLVLTADLYKNDAISIAIVILVQLYVVRLVMSTQEIAEMIKSYETIMSTAHSSVKTMLIEPTVTDKPAPQRLPKHAVLDIDFQNVSYRYNDAAKNVFAVKDFKATIKQGEKVGIVGFSGSGKTTLTKLLLRFTDVTKGSITVGGVDIRDLSQQQLRQVISYVPQEPLLFHRSIRENIAYGKPVAKKDAVISAAKAAYVDEFIGQLPKGYETLVGERGVKLSGGQRQRVTIARALLKDAPILVLDEATSSLDSQSEQYIQKALWKLMKDRTALVIAHRLSTIQHLDKIIVVDSGRVVQAGTHEELLKDTSGIYAKLWNHQSGGYIGVDTVPG